MQIPMTPDGEREHLLPPREEVSKGYSRGVFLSWRVAIVLGLCWVASLGFVARTGVDPLELANKDKSYDPDFLTMMKRTHLSIDAIRGGKSAIVFQPSHPLIGLALEGTWLQTHLGFGDGTTEYWFNYTGTQSLDHFDIDKRSTYKKEALKGLWWLAILVFCVISSLILLHRV